MSLTSEERGNLERMVDFIKENFEMNWETFSGTRGEYVYWAKGYIYGSTYTSIIDDRGRRPNMKEMIEIKETIERRTNELFDLAAELPDHSEIGGR